MRCSRRARAAAGGLAARGTSSLGLVVAGTLLFYFHLRAKALSPAITEARLQALQARIRPHFLFNSINAVLSLIRAEPRRAETALEDMADLFRVLMRDNRDLVPLADEVELCRQYLALEQLRLGDRLRVEWHVNEHARRRAGAAAGAAAAARERRLPRHRAVERAGRGLDQHLRQGRRRCTRSCAIRTARKAAGITPATRWRSATCASASRCISTPRRPRVARQGRQLRSAHPDAVPHRRAHAPVAAAPAAVAADRERGRGARIARRVPRRAETRRRPPVTDAPLRILIVDDEAPARRRLRELLDDCADVLPLDDRRRGGRPAARRSSCCTRCRRTSC